MTLEQSSRSRGRPRVVARDAIQVAAVELFLDQGYAATTMDQVAVAAGVGRTTVFRYFASKPALVWWDVEANYDRLDAALRASATASAEASSGGPIDVIDQVRHAVHVALVEIGTSSDLMRRRWALIDQDPAVAAELAVLMMRWATRIAAHVREVLGDAVPSVNADSVGYAVLGATVGASRQWSVDVGDRSLADVLDDVMAPLGVALRAMVDPR
ncbi:TetR/AcrR family transcriptional regulator [Nocardioides sp. C4-1]|uniref:TetR/AcrR family transcriptional regulator n=1 Tax=Nocardioides sp. C4-1 TaxID=3151851 RepID=UPI003263F7B5